MIKCECRNLIFDGLTFKGVSVAQFSMGHANIKCKNCKRWINGIDARIFIGLDITYDFSKGGNDGKGIDSGNPPQEHS